MNCSVRSSKKGRELSEGVLPSPTLAAIFRSDPNRKSKDTSAVVSGDDFSSAPLDEMITPRSVGRLTTAEFV